MNRAEPTEARMISATKPGPNDYRANFWEREEIANIKEWYEEMRFVIENWEAKKKKKARSKLEKTEAKLDKKTAKAVSIYNSEITSIEEIAQKAKAKAEKNRKIDESKVKEKGNEIRLTGKLPATCLCF